MISMTSMTSMTSMIAIESPPAGAAVPWLDLAAFFVMGLLWIVVFAMLHAIHRILRSKARGDSYWGDSPGL